MSTISLLRCYCGPHANGVMRIVGCTRDHLSDYILQGGLDYVARVKNKRAAEQLLHSRPFWNWFKLYWYSVDAEFVSNFSGTRQSKQSYMDLHEAFLENVTPPSFIIIKQQA